MRESLVDASLRKEWKNHLVSLCSDYRYIPKSLDIKGLAYPNEERGPIDFGGSEDILLAELDGKKVVVKILRADKAIRVSLKKHKWGVSMSIWFVIMFHLEVGFSIAFARRSFELDRIRLPRSQSIFRYHNGSSTQRFRYRTGLQISTPGGFY